MTRTAQSLTIADLSDFARDLHRQLGPDTAPGHLRLLNMLARAAGYQNFQHLRAQTHAAARIAAPVPRIDPDVDHHRVETALRYFDTMGRMHSWPARTQMQHLCLWALWSWLPPRAVLTERQISAALNARHLFGDAAILRRTLLELKLISRTPDCTAYTRLEQAPPPESAALIRALHLRQG